MQRRITGQNRLRTLMRSPMLLELRRMKTRSRYRREPRFPVIYGQPINYAVGDCVTRGGDDVQLVTYMSDDRFSGTFECVVAPADGWCAVGDVEENLCRRYTKVTYDHHNI